MIKAIIYILSIFGKILFSLFYINGILATVIANVFFGYSISQHQYDLAIAALGMSYLLASLVTFWVYYIDKRAAIKGLWRIPERRLHYLELIGGWIGALFAQKILNHKSTKASYQLTYWVIVIFHLSVFLLFLPFFKPELMPIKYILMLIGFLLVIALGRIRK